MRSTNSRNSSIFQRYFIFKGLTSDSELDMPRSHCYLTFTQSRWTPLRYGNFGPPAIFCGVISFCYGSAHHKWKLHDYIIKYDSTCLRHEGNYRAAPVSFIKPSPNTSSVITITRVAVSGSRVAPIVLMVHTPQTAGLSGIGERWWSAQLYGND